MLARGMVLREGEKQGQCLKTRSRQMLDKLTCLLAEAEGGRVGSGTRSALKAAGSSQKVSRQHNRWIKKLSSPPSIHLAAAVREKRREQGQTVA